MLNTNREIVDALNEFGGKEILLKEGHIRITKAIARELLAYRMKNNNPWNVVFPPKGA